LVGIVRGGEDFLQRLLRLLGAYLTSLDEEIIASLREKVRRKGGNGLVGVRIDSNEISGGTSMLMMRAAGTPVTARPLADDVETPSRLHPVGPLLN
jgi:uncharacterized protein YbjQ (UPF0145 family)